MNRENKRKRDLQQYLHPIFSGASATYQPKLAGDQYHIYQESGYAQGKRRMQRKHIVNTRYRRRAERRRDYQNYSHRKEIKPRDKNDITIEYPVHNQNVIEPPIPNETKPLPAGSRSTAGATFKSCSRAKGVVAIRPTAVPKAAPAATSQKSCFLA